MLQNHQKISEQISHFVKAYTEMDILCTTIHCPYWMNKIKNKQVVLHGFLDGKGDANQIRQELVSRLKDYSSSDASNQDFLRKFARRERIGIDCSGFAYRFLNKLASLRYNNCQVDTLDKVFGKGINKVDANQLTSKQNTVLVKKVSDARTGDLVRMMGGKHVAVILEVKNDLIFYIHSSNLTNEQGAHIGRIQITNIGQSLKYQLWLEETRNGYNFGKKYYHEEKGDGIYRLKIFA